MQEKARSRIHSSLGSLTLLTLCCILLTSISGRAQADRSITILMLDSQSGKPIATSELQIWTGKSLASAKTAGISPHYVKPRADSTAEKTFADGENVFSVHAQYGPANWGYVNCDGLKDHSHNGERWYSIAEVLSSGIAAPNHCSRQKAVAKPGQFVFFVRQPTFWEKFQQ
jgi:hypothetical protein